MIVKTIQTENLVRLCPLRVRDLELFLGGK